MSRKRVILLRFAALLLAALAFVAWNPGGVVSQGLRDNFVAELVGSLVTLLFLERALDAVVEKEEARARREFRRTLLLTLEGDLHALWSLLREPLARDDPIRRAPREDRVRRFLDDLSSADAWLSAPQGHAKAVRGRLRDLGEDAERMLILSESAAGFDVRARLDALRRACRDMDEGWEGTPRGGLAERFATTVRPHVDALVALASSSRE